MLFSGSVSLFAFLPVVLPVYCGLLRGTQAGTEYLFTGGFPFLLRLGGALVCAGYDGLRSGKLRLWPLGAHLEAAVPAPHRARHRRRGVQPGASFCLQAPHLCTQHGGPPAGGGIRFPDGTLAFVNAEPLDVTDCGNALVPLSRTLDQREIPMLCVQAPQKLLPDDERLPTGVVDYGNDYADQVLAVLEAHQVDAPQKDLLLTPPYFTCFEVIS